MSDLYANPALRQSELNRQGTMQQIDPTKPEIMDSVFFNIENNTFKILNSNRKGQALDDESKGSLLDPKDVWEKYGVKTETPISSGNAERMRDNMDEVAQRNYNLSFLERTSLNQARTFLNGMAGPILTDPVQIGLSIISGGLLGAASKTLGRSNAVYNAARLATSTGLGRITTAVAFGAAEGAIEGFIESEILLDQAPKAGLKFDDKDYWNNVRANVFFSSALGGIRQGAGELRAIRDSKNTIKNFVEAEANAIPRNVVPHRENYKDNSPRGRMYTTHFSNDGKFNFDTQTPISKSDFGKGYQFSTSKEWAFSDKGLGLNRKESVFEFDIEDINLKLFDAENAIPLEMKRKLIDSLREDIGDLPPSVVKEMETGDITVNELADILSVMDKKNNTVTLDKLSAVIKEEGFQGYSFSDGTLDPATGRLNRGVHLFEMPEGAGVSHLNPDTPPAPRSTDIPAEEAKRLDQQKQLDYYAEKTSNIDHSREFDSELEKVNTQTVSDPLEEFNSEKTSINEMNLKLEEEIEYLKEQVRKLEPTEEVDIKEREFFQSPITGFRATNEIKDIADLDLDPTDIDKGLLKVIRGNELARIGDIGIGQTNARKNLLHNDPTQDILSGELYAYTEDGVVGTIEWDGDGVRLLGVSEGASPFLAPKLIKEAIKLGSPPTVAGSISEKAADLANKLAMRERKNKIRKIVSKAYDRLDALEEPEKVREIAKATDFCVRN